MGNRKVYHYEGLFRQVRSYRSWRWNGQRPPQHKPPYTHIWVDDDERVWVSLHTPSVFNAASGKIRERWTEKPVFDIVTLSGQYIGKVSYDGQIYPQVARGNRLWAIVQDEYGLIRIRRYRIRW